MLWLGVAGIALSTAVNAVIIFVLLYWALVSQRKNAVESVTVSRSQFTDEGW